MEKPIGLEALGNYPFTDVVLSQDMALDILTQNSHKVLALNAGLCIDLIDSKNPEGRAYIDRLRKLQISPGAFFPPGGSSMSKEELRRIYRDWGSLTFEEVVHKFMGEIFPTFFDENSKQSREPGVICTCYLLDILRIIDPKVASFDDGVKTVINVMRKDNHMLLTSPFLLGAMIDDTIHLRRTTQERIDFLADKEGAIKFKDAFLRFANDNEREAFEKGLTITLNEILIRTSGVSLN
ncbi:MAG: hypothetical protein Q7S60_01515 [bacterium]|nr:hypothetical protein [bacterium]